MNEDIRPVNSVLQLEKLYFDECTFKRNDDLSIGENGISYDYNYQRTITRMDDRTYRVSLRGNVISKDQAIEVHARAVGVFSVDSEDRRVKNQLISKNTISLLMSYVRSQIILVTSQSGLPPIVLPVVNIAEMFPDAPLPGEAEE